MTIRKMTELEMDLFSRAMKAEARVAELEAEMRSVATQMVNADRAGCCKDFDNEVSKLMPLFRAWVNTAKENADA